MTIEDHKKCLILAGKLAIAAENMVRANMFNASVRVDALNKALTKYNDEIMYHAIKESE